MLRLLRILRIFFCKLSEIARFMKDMPFLKVDYSVLGSSGVKLGTISDLGVGILVSGRTFLLSRSFLALI